jgi:hypothetical protein
MTHELLASCCCSYEFEVVGRGLVPGQEVLANKQVAPRRGCATVLYNIYLYAVCLQTAKADQHDHTAGKMPAAALPT